MSKLMRTLSRMVRRAREDDQQDVLQAMYDLNHNATGGQWTLKEISMSSGVRLTNAAAGLGRLEKAGLVAAKDVPGGPIYFSLTEKATRYLKQRPKET